VDDLCRGSRERALDRRHSEANQWPMLSTFSLHSKETAVFWHEEPNCAMCLIRVDMVSLSSGSSKNPIPTGYHSSNCIFTTAVTTTGCEWLSNNTCRESRFTAYERCSLLQVTADIPLLIKVRLHVHSAQLQFCSPRTMDSGTEGDYTDLRFSPPHSRRKAQTMICC